jgi:alkyl hydroperoxide reductase subunit F
MFDLAILGGGPAGVSAGVYAARKKLKTVLITKDFGGQSIVSDGIENWIGDKNIPGPELAKKLEDHLRNYEDGIDIKTGEFVSKVSKIDGGFEVETDKEKYQAKTVLVATGSSRKKLQAKGADKYENKGIVYCASCDGPLFSGKDVVVIGGGNAGFETAAQLLAYAKSVTLLHHSAEFKADPVTVEAVKKDSKMTLIKNAETTEIFGETLVKGLKYEDKESGEEKTLNVEGVFVEIGSVPTTEFVKDIVPLDEFNRIKIDPWTQRSEIEGVWAAGDCSNIRYHQNNIAAGDAVRALEDIYLYIKKLEG